MRMENIKYHIRKNKTLVNLIISLIGAAAIGFSGNIGNANWENICLGIGTSFLSSGIIVLITTFLLDEENENERILKEWGIEAAYSTRGEMNISCDHYLRNANSIDIIAFGLRSLRDSQSDTIRKMLANGGKIRIITMKPDCENLIQREKDELQEVGSISHTIRQLSEWAEALNKEGYKGKIEIRYYDSQPLEFMFLMDNRLFNGPYEYGKGSQQTISFEYSNRGRAYKYYSDYFNGLWNDENFCSEA